MMNLEEWKVRFAKWQLERKAHWIVDEGELRTWFPSEHSCCPITAEFDRPECDYPECSAALELDVEAEHLIIEAADGDAEHDPELRAWLLETCGLQEEEAA